MGHWDGRYSDLIFRDELCFKHQMTKLDWKNKLSKTAGTFTACTYLPSCHCAFDHAMQISVYRQARRYVQNA